MGLFLQLICLFVVTAFSYSSVIPQLPKYVVKDAGDPVGVTCPQNISNAWLDIVIAIDISTNMGPSQVRQITLNLASELSKYVISQGQVGDPNHYTRVAIITYGSNATVLYDLAKINSNQMFQSAITSVVGSTSDGVSNITDAMTQAYNLIYDQQPCDEPFGCQKVARPPVLVLFAASVNGDTNSIYKTAQQIQQLGTIIPVNYNPTNTMLTSLLNTIATPGMYFAKPWVAKDMDWALLQSNCFCTWWAGLQLVVMEPSTQRYTRYAECFNVWDLIGGSLNLNDTDVCGSSEVGYPAAINAQATSDFIKKMLKEEIPNQFYIGLHRQGHSPTGKWMWYTFGGNDMPMGTFNDWASDADPNAPVTCAEEKRQPGSTQQNPIYKWEPVSCELWDTGATNVICSLKACTSDNFCVTAIPSEFKSTKSRPRLPKNKQVGQLKGIKH